MSKDLTDAQCSDPPVCLVINNSDMPMTVKMSADVYWMPLWTKTMRCDIFYFCESQTNLLTERLRVLRAMGCCAD